MKKKKKLASFCNLQENCENIVRFRLSCPPVWQVALNAARVRASNQTQTKKYINKPRVGKKHHNSPRVGFCIVMASKKQLNTRKVEKTASSDSKK